MPEAGANHGGLILGIDVGSVSISLVSVDREGRLKGYDYKLHQGNIRETLDQLLLKHVNHQVLGVATPSGKSHFNKGSGRINNFIFVNVMHADKHGPLNRQA